MSNGISRVVRGVRASIGPEHLLASSALPFLFPAVDIAGRFYGDLSPQAREALPLREIDILEIQPSQDVRKLAEHYRDKLPPGAKLLLRGLGAGHGHGQLLCYFLFESGFIYALMKLGYHDTMAKRETLQQFFCKHGVTSF